MTRKPIRAVAVRIAAGAAGSLLIACAAYRFHFNLSSATSVQLFLVTAIALRWGFLEAGIVSLFSFACLDVFFTEPLFRFYIADHATGSLWAPLKAWPWLLAVSRIRSGAMLAS